MTASAIAARVKRAARRAPTSRDWAETVLAAGALALLVGPVGLRTGLLRYAPRPASEVIAIAVGALIAPAIGEEVPFRAAAIPDRSEAARAIGAIALSTALFTAWHVAEALVFLPRARRLFLRPDFLAWTAALGLSCAVLRRRSGSLWPPVLLHWAAVVAWQGWLGGPSVRELR